MTASPAMKTIHGASTIRSVPVIRVVLQLLVRHDQCTRYSCGCSEADMVMVWRQVPVLIWG